MSGYSKISYLGILCLAFSWAQPVLASKNTASFNPPQISTQFLVAQNDEAPETQEEKAFSTSSENNTEPEISYDLKALPFSTRRMHELILEATKAGDIEKLRALIGTGEHATQLTLGEMDGDAIDFLKSLSGDEEGLEIMAILEEVLEAGYVHVDAGTEQEMFVWPYFFSVPLESLTKQQKVELFRIVTYGDYKEFQEFGNYIFYRVGITPNGKWVFFVAGD